MANRACDIFSFLVALLLLSSCEKNPFSNGPVVTEDRGMQSRVRVIEIHDNVSVKLVHSETTHIEVTAGANVIQGLSTTFSGDTLILRNENGHNWLRPYNEPFEATVYYDRIGTINYKSTGTLTALDSIHGDYITDSLGLSQWIFRLNLLGGAGDIDLLLRCNQVRTDFQYGTSNVTLRGRTIGNVIFMRSYGSIHAENLKANLVSVETKSPNHCYIWATQSIKAKIHSLGNVYYKGDPWDIELECGSEGRFLKMD